MAVFVRLTFFYYSSDPRPVEPLFTNPARLIAMVDGGPTVITVVRLGVRFRFYLYRLRISEYPYRVRLGFGFLCFRWHDLSPFDDQLGPEFLQRYRRVFQLFIRPPFYRTF